MPARVLALLLVVLLSLPALAGELTGTVVGISDGDTLRLLVGREQVVIRLDQIDAPEKAQPFGTRSRQSLAELCHQRDVRVVEGGRDRYGRTIGTVFVDGVNVSAEQVRRGMAWVFVRYARDPALYAIEREAREAGRGVWTDPDPIPPWEWRRQRR